MKTEKNFNIHGIVVKITVEERTETYEYENRVIHEKVIGERNRWTVVGMCGLKEVYRNDTTSESEVLGIVSSCESALKSHCNELRKPKEKTIWGKLKERGFN